MIDSNLSLLSSKYREKYLSSEGFLGILTKQFFYFVLLQ